MQNRSDELLVAQATLGREESLAALVRRSTPLVARIMAKHRNIDHEVVLAECIAQLPTMIHAYDPRRGVSWRTFAIATFRRIVSQRVSRYTKTSSRRCELSEATLAPEGVNLDRLDIQRFIASLTAQEHQLLALLAKELPRRRILQLSGESSHEALRDRVRALRQRAYDFGLEAVV